MAAFVYNMGGNSIKVPVGFAGALVYPKEEKKEQLNITKIIEFSNIGTEVNWEHSTSATGLTIMALDTNNNLYLSGQRDSIIQQLNSQGTVINSFPQDIVQLFTINLDNENNIITGGSPNTVLQNGGGEIRKYQPDFGEEVWKHTHPSGGEHVVTLDIDQYNDIYVGYDENNHLYKIDGATGKEVWIRTISFAYKDPVFKVVADKTNNLIYAISTKGCLLQTTKDNTESNYYQISSCKAVRALTIDNNGNLYCAYKNNNDAFVLEKISFPINLWTKSFTSQIMDITTDIDNNIYVLDKNNLYKLNSEGIELARIPYSDGEQVLVDSENRIYMLNESEICSQFNQTPYLKCYY